MELGLHKVNMESPAIRAIFKRLSDEKIDAIQQVCEQYGENPQDIRRYNVFVIRTPQRSLVLKRADSREVFNYERYLSQSDLPVPKYYGKWQDGSGFWILMEHIGGHDLRDMTDALARSAAESLVKIQNAYWIDEDAQSEDQERFDAYWERIGKRYSYIKPFPKIGEAYAIFRERQLHCPRTLSHADFLPCNLIEHGSETIAVDWGFGGILPYSLDIARFIAHATEDRATFPFYMNQNQKRIFLEHVYAGLQKKPAYTQFLYDIRLAVLNEYVEFMEAEEDVDGWYYQHALQLSAEICRISPINIVLRR